MKIEQLWQFTANGVAAQSAVNQIVKKDIKDTAIAIMFHLVANGESGKHGIKRIMRTARLTQEEAKKYNKIRKQVEKEFKPKKKENNK